MNKNIDKFTKDFNDLTGPFAINHPITDDNNIIKPMDLIVYPNPMDEYAVVEFNNPDNELFIKSKTS